MAKRGLFIAIEGTDGSGKTTQFNLLVRSLRRMGRQVSVVDFPQYGRPSAYFVEQYLNGRYGTAKQVGPYRGSIFYTLDRYVTAPKIRHWLKQGRVVVANRYTWSSAAHQGGKLKTAAARRKYWQWLFGLEFKVFQIPKPNMVIILHMPAKVAQTLIGNKPKRRYITRPGQKDIHEADLKHLASTEHVYLELARLSRARLIECVEGRRLLTPKEVHRKVMSNLRFVRH